MIILITGSVGSGKTKLAKKLASVLRYEYIEIKEIAKKCGKKTKAYGEEILEVETKCLKREIEKLAKKKKNLIIESHLLVEEKFPGDVIIVLRCHPKLLIKRLRKRGYNNEKIRDNVLLECLDYFEIKAEEKYGENINVIKYGRSSLKKLLEIVKRGKNIREKVDFSSFIPSLLHLSTSKVGKRKEGAQ